MTNKTHKELHHLRNIDRALAQEAQRSGNYKKYCDCSENADNIEAVCAHANKPLPPWVAKEGE